MAVKLKGPEGHSGFGFRGLAFEPDADGLIDVPHEALDEAFSHGFELAAEADEKPKKKSGKDAPDGGK